YYDVNSREKSRMSQYTQHPAQDQRNWSLWVWLALVILYNVFTIISFLTGGNNPLAYITPEDNVTYSSAAVLVVNIAAAAAIIFAVVTGLGYRIGYYGLVISYIVMTIASLLIGFNIGIVLAAGLVALI